MKSSLFLILFLITSSYGMSQESNDDILRQETTLGVNYHSNTQNYQTRDALLYKYHGRRCFVRSTGEYQIFDSINNEWFTMYSLGNQYWRINATGIHFASGNVGIGKKNAMYRLDIKGDVNFTGSLFQNDTLFQSGPWYRNDSVSGLFWQTLRLSDSAGIRIGNTSPSGQLSNIYINTMGSYYHGNSFSAGGHFNIGITHDGLSSNLTGTSNILMGYFTGYNLTTGSNNIFIGQSAGEHISTSSFNIALGKQSLDGQSGNYNIGIGMRAGYGADGTGNIYIGQDRVGYKVQGDNNIAIGGNEVLYHGSNVNVSNTIAIGSYRTGRDAVGDKNIYLGYQVGNDWSGGSEVLLIDHEKPDNQQYFIQGYMGLDSLIINANLHVQGEIYKNGQPINNNVEPATPVCDTLISSSSILVSAPNLFIKGNTTIENFLISEVISDFEFVHIEFEQFLILKNNGNLSIGESTQVKPGMIYTFQRRGNDFKLCVR